MPLDLSAISPKGRERYLRIGRGYGSGDTLKQANKTLKALESHAADLAHEGFAAEDAATLLSARDALIDAGVGRDEHAGKKRACTRTYAAALHDAKAARARAQTILTAAQRVLEDADEQDAARAVEATLAQHRIQPDDSEKLASQLDALRAALTLAKVADAAKTRGGGEAAKDLETTANDLRAAAEEREATGTQLSTEQMDVIDGIIVTLCRSARNAARNVTTQPALAKAFALNHLAPPPPRDDEETPPAP